MDIRLLPSPEDLERYGRWVPTHPAGSLWQSAEWKGFQESLGRDVCLYAAEKNGRIAATALVVIDKGRMGSTWEIPRGPLADTQEDGAALLRRIMDDARNAGAMALFFSPMDALMIGGSEPSGRHVQPDATRILDLTQSEEELLAGMKQKGRYNIRLAEKNGVTVRLSDDTEAFAALSRQTGMQDGFRPPSARQYRNFLQKLPGSFLLMAYGPESTEKPVAGLIGVRWEGKGIYYYGASDRAHRALMAPYALQWAAMRLCKEQGCTAYDLFGIAPPGQPHHPWAGVSDFKEKFGGSVVMYPQEQQVVLRAWKHRLVKMKRKILG